MKIVATSLIALCLIGSTGKFRVNAQGTKATRPTPAAAVSAFNRITPEELSLLLADVGESNPMALVRFKDNPDARRAQLDSLRQLLAFASQAEKDGLANDPIYRRELANIRNEVISVQYDRYLNKAAPQAAPFSRISKARIDGYWTGENRAGESKADREKRFEEFFQTKLAILKENSPEQKDRDITDPEKQEARDFFAKIQLSASEYAASKAVPPTLRKKIDLNVKLQQAQFLARLYSNRAMSDASPSEEEIAAYLEAHPELETSAQRMKAAGILARAKTGEDFAKLANEFSEDPGNKNDRDEPQGGIYRNVKQGMMVAPFELAALSLEAGKIYPQLVESDFGYHIIKLERKGKALATDSEETYDVRHILISTTVANPSDPSGRPLPRKDYVRSQVQAEKEQRFIDDLVTKNKISLPDDFVVAAVKVPTAAPSAKPKAKAARKHD